MLAEVPFDFLLDETNFNGLRPWEASEFSLEDLTSAPGSQRKKKDLGGCDYNQRYYFKCAMQLIEPGGGDFEEKREGVSVGGVSTEEHQEFKAEYRKRDRYFKEQV